MPKRWTTAVAVAVVVGATATGCGGLSVVDDNSTEVCADLATVDPNLAAMMTLTNPEGTIADARFSNAYYRKTMAEQRGDFNDSQLRLLDRVTTAMEQYEGVLATKPVESRMADSQPALDSLQMNIIANYRIMVDSIGCPAPDFLAQFPKT